MNFNFCTCQTCKDIYSENFRRVTLEKLAMQIQCDYCRVKKFPSPSHENTVYIIPESKKVEEWLPVNKKIISSPESELETLDAKRAQLIEELKTELAKEEEKAAKVAKYLKESK